MKVYQEPYNLGKKKETERRKTSKHNADLIQSKAFHSIYLECTHKVSSVLHDSSKS